MALGQARPSQGSVPTGGAGGADKKPEFALPGQGEPTEGAAKGRLDQAQGERETNKGGTIYIYFQLKYTHIHDKLYCLFSFTYITAHRCHTRESVWDIDLKVSHLMKASCENLKLSCYFATSCDTAIFLSTVAAMDFSSHLYISQG